MGMFDDLTCKMDLPDCGEPCPHISFQTKSFPDPYMDKYVIGPDGKLSRNGSPFDFHGIVNFYTLAEGTDQSWWEWDAKFTDGVCVEIIARIDQIH